MSWKQVEQVLLGAGGTSGTKAQLKKLRGLVVELVGSEQQEVEVDDACVGFVRDLILLQHVSLELMKKYKKLYGTATPAQVEKIHRAVRELRDHVSEDQLGSVLGDKAAVADETYFGSKIKFTYAPALPSDEELSYLQDISQKKFSLQTQLTFDYDTIAGKQAAAASSTGTKATIEWLENTIRSFYGEEQPLGMSTPEFAVTIMEKLNTKKSPEELQTELFDLCGFDRFDMIGAILEKRDELVQSFKVF